MSKISIVTGIVLIVLGVGLYIVTGFKSWTALIPAILGGIIAGSGALAQKPSRRALFAHIALLFGALGFLAGLGRGMMVWMRDGSVGAGVAGNLLMGVVCAVYVFMCIRSFRAARLAKQAE